MDGDCREIMEYIKLFWNHELDEEPVIIFYEVNTDDERSGIRSIDIFADGTTKNIDDLYEGAIEITPIPTVEELNAGIWGEGFHASLIDKEAFDKVWEECFYSMD